MPQTSPYAAVLTELEPVVAQNLDRHLAIAKEWHPHDYVPWDEGQIVSTIIDRYDWETAPDTKSTWRIGDGTAAFYNFIYWTAAGFTESDTFRAGQDATADTYEGLDGLLTVVPVSRPRVPHER